MSDARKHWILRKMLQVRRDDFNCGDLLFLMCNGDASCLDQLLHEKFPQETWETLELKMTLATGDAYEMQS